MSIYNMLLNIMTLRPAKLVSYHWNAVPGIQVVNDLLESLEATLWHVTNTSHCMEVSNQVAPSPAMARAQPQGLLRRKSTRAEGKFMVTQDAPWAQPTGTKLKTALSSKLPNSFATNVSRVGLPYLRAWTLGQIFVWLAMFILAIYFTLKFSVFSWRN